MMSLLFKVKHTALSTTRLKRQEQEIKRELNPLRCEGTCFIKLLSVSLQYYIANPIVSTKRPSSWTAGTLLRTP